MKLYRVKLTGAPVAGKRCRVTVYAVCAKSDKDAIEQVAKAQPHLFAPAPLVAVSDCESPVLLYQFDQPLKQGVSA